MSSDWGLKIAQTGYDVKTCTDNHLVYSSEYPQLKMHSSGSGTYTATGATLLGFSTVLTTHNLGYRPFFILWVDIGSGYQIVPVSFTGGTYNLSIFGTTKENTLEMGMVSLDTANPLWEEETIPPDDPITVDYSWVLFYDPAQNE